MVQFIGKYCCLLSMTYLLACNGNNSDVERENDLLRRENDLLRKESEWRQKEVSAQGESASAQAEKESWKEFGRPGGYGLELPAYFHESPSTSTGVRRFANDIDGGILVTIEPFGEATEGLLESYYLSYVGSSVGVDYKVLRDRFFVVSGLVEGTIYYYKMTRSNGSLYFLKIEYPASYKELFDQTLPRISKSFK